MRGTACKELEADRGSLVEHDGVDQASATGLFPGKPACPCSSSLVRWREDRLLEFLDFFFKPSGSRFTAGNP